jgi:hypothetical protein
MNTTTLILEEGTDNMFLILISEITDIMKITMISLTSETKMAIKGTMNYQMTNTDRNTDLDYWVSQWVH